MVNIPYADKAKQREAVNRAVKKHYQRVKEAQKNNKPVYPRTVGRPIGTLTYDTPEMVELAIKKQERRLETLEQRRGLYAYESNEYRNNANYISKTKARIQRLRSQLEQLKTAKKD